MNKSLVVLLIFLVVGFLLSGCGETVHGVVKDTKRIGSGIKQVFIRDSN